MDWIEVNGASLRYELSGSGDKVLVLVHEMGGTLESWDQVLPALSRGRRVLRYDTRGAGMSEKVRGTLSFDTMADDIAALLDALGIKQKVTLAGCAVGGGIVLHFAVRHAERVATVIAMGPATGVEPDRRAATLERASQMEREGARAMVDIGFANSYPPAVRHDAEQYRKFRARWIANDPDGFAAIVRMLADSAVTDKLPRINCPALLLAGTQDPLRPPAAVKLLAQLIPNAQFRPLETGHFMAVQTPKLVADAMLEFLAASGN
jgi:3-oxoadipate enol-lactonase